MIASLLMLLQSASGANIKKVVHLMMENRSFDNIFGFMTHHPEIDGLQGKKYCSPLEFEKPDAKLVCTSMGQPDIGPHNPDHEMYDVLLQMYGKDKIQEGDLDRPPMTGFAAQAMKKSYKGDVDHIEQIMQSFDPLDIPIHRTLAEEYTISDRWFASVPGPTQPNRAYVHSATSHGMYTNDPTTMLLGMPQRTIFNDLLDEGHSWKSYFQEVPSLAVFSSVRRDMITRTRMMSQFYKDCENGQLAAYSFLEPFYGELAGHHGYSNDGESFSKAELLIKRVYEAVRHSVHWNETLLIITYDEHGGFFDHVPPPQRVPSPDGIVSVDKEHPQVTHTFTLIHEPNGPYPDSQNGPADLITSF
ncbi:phosphoesterase [Gorgonomyces haynaldii]|nr:phosphoesterase [Gorgonomyces haynaldii]